jgi:hypothetical protein
MSKVGGGADGRCGACGVCGAVFGEGVLVGVCGGAPEGDGKAPPSIPNAAINAPNKSCRSGNLYPARFHSLAMFCNSLCALAAFPDAYAKAAFHKRVE